MYASLLKEVHLMSKVKTPWEILPKFCLLGFGVPLFVIGILVCIHNGNRSFLINGIVWLMVGIACVTKNRYDQRKLRRLKEDGLCYSGTVSKISPNHCVRIGSYITARVVCSYIGETGAVTVSSNHFLLTPFDTKEHFRVWVYLSRVNSRKFSVELYRTEE